MWVCTERTMHSAVQSRCSWLIGVYKTVTNVENHFQCKTRVLFRELTKYRTNEVQNDPVKHKWNWQFVLNKVQTALRSIQQAVLYGGRVVSFPKHKSIILTQRKPELDWAESDLRDSSTVWRREACSPATQFCPDSPETVTNCRNDWVKWGDHVKFEAPNIDICAQRDSAIF